ncbi:isoprenylcysteine carboxyl methyltransferase [Cryobacterium sp. LW097]|uniref:methyltransferase family protein n=1 Tax=Cryobacterium sp. LW097 TaxID=1978566 RepID=UPI000B4C7529|nr:isoprenylcysteine carboxylmethyltransferase family protein [Cryobacterium sp. LW097]ASD21800.1 isoprenylcysteine carboxyl methyltransferase [Cryobacterium sp. LW097]
MKRALASGLVFVQIVLLVGLLVLPHGTVWPVNGFVVATAIALIAVGVALAVQGSTTLGPAMTASPIPRDDAPLATNGVYAVVRNPIYTGLMSGGLGLVVIGSSLMHVVVWVALIGLLAGKTRWEEQMLFVEHPAYSDYAARVGRFLPGVGRIR